MAAGVWQDVNYPYVYADGLTQLVLVVRWLVRTAATIGGLHALWQWVGG